MRTYTPELAFRGRRSYLHSTDLYEALIAGTDACGIGPVDKAVELKFRLPLTAQPLFCYPDDGESGRPEEPSVEFVVGVGNRSIHGWIQPTDRPVIGCKVYNEQPIWERARVSGRTITVVADSGARPIEVLTAQGVLLHNTLWPPGSSLKWLLAELVLTRPLRPRDAVQMTLSIERVAGGNMTWSTIISEEGPIGKVLFIRSRLPERKS